MKLTVDQLASIKAQAQKRYVLVFMYPSGPYVSSHCDVREHAEKLARFYSDTGIAIVVDTEETR